MYYAMRASAPSLYRESTNSLIHVMYVHKYICIYLGRVSGLVGFARGSVVWEGDHIRLILAPRDSKGDSKSHFCLLKENRM